MTAIKELKSYYTTLDKYKKAFWIYLFLIFIEGSMRKWFMPGLSSVWMICREPIVIWTVLSLMGSQYLRSTIAKAFMFIGIIMFLATMTMGHQNFGVAFFGFRIWFFHIPYIFIIADKLNREDLINICRFLIIAFIPMTLLYVAQWASPPSSWLNASIGGFTGKEGSEFAYGATRPTGTFGHGIASSYYNPVVVSLFLTALFSPFYKKVFIVMKRGYSLLIIAVLLCLITSVSRSTIIQSAITALFIAFILSLYGNHKYIKRLIVGFIVIFISFNVISKISIGGKGLLDPITNRFEAAAEVEGGSSGILETRVLEPYRFWNDKGKTLNPPVFGYGIGAGSNFGTQVLNLGNGKAWGLGEWSSQIVTNEMGFLFGTIVFFLRVGFCFYLFPLCLKRLKRNKDILPICLWALSVNYFGNGNINLTMTLGWIVIVMIMILLSIRTSTRIYNDK